MRCRFFIPVTMLAACVAVTGCASNQSAGTADTADPDPTPPRTTMQEEGRAVLGGSRNASSNSSEPGATLWTIILRTCGGPNQESVAFNVLNGARTDAGVGEAYAEKRGNNTVIAYGRYTGPDDPRAKADLARLRELIISGSRPFPGAFLAPPVGHTFSGSVPEFDLRNAQQLFGDNEAIYTLQIGLYGRTDGKPPSQQDLSEFRKAAEQAAFTLRNDGEMAFYYHALERSTVTVGVFSHEDYKPYEDNPYESPLLQDLRKRHSYSLLNGAAYKPKLPNGRTAPDPVKSALVRIPKRES